jgi:lipopolysaccharide transport system ATP-binding protein
VDPEILVVHEVLSVGDTVFQQKCMARMKAIMHSGATVLFVSHNLRAVSELCSRALLLEHGKMAAIGPASQVIREYVNRSCAQRIIPADVPAYIASVTIRDGSGENATFDAGQRVWVDIEVVSRVPTQKLAISLSILDVSGYNVFDTSTERLGMGSFTLDKEERFACTFELQLNLARGTFYPSITLCRYDIQEAYDRWSPAATIYVRSDIDVRGAANCFPRVTKHESVTHAAMS